jgi:predicted TIM-barrel fold metal-dependent hydrolase
VIRTPILSCDSHISEPEDLWSSRLPEADLYRTPSYSRMQDKKIYRVNGKMVSITDEYRRFYRNGELVAVNPRTLPDDVVAEPIERDDLEGRLADMARDGVYGETMHPNVGQFIFDIEDPEFCMRCARIYNDYVLERYADPRLVPNALISVRDIPMAVAEIERVAAKGARGIELAIQAPAGAPYYLDKYEPVWAAAAAHGFPIAFHAGSGVGIDFVNRSVPWPNDSADVHRAAVAMKTTTGGFQGQAGVCAVTIPSLIAAGVCERYPDLHLVFVETGARWLALLMDNMDCAWGGMTVDREVQRTFFKGDGSPVNQYPDEFFDAKWELPLLPSEYVKRQIHVGFMDDHLALRNRHITGIEPLLWGNDYPHYEGTWPSSQATIDAMVARYDLTDDEKAAIFGGTLAKIYNIELRVAA